MIGGLLACGLTHTAVVTLDVAKCRAQAHSKAGRWPKGLIPGIQRIIAEEGTVGMTRGWVPTLFGYGAQGLFKFGFNELFKDIYTRMIGEKNVDSQWKKMALWAAASGSAEIFADVALCPFEMTKVKMQVSLPGAEAQFPSKFGAAFGLMSANRAETKFPFGSLYPLWGRQIPYTMIKFVGFYQTAEMIYSYLDRNHNIKKSDMSEAKQLVVTFLAGYWAGIFCAIATQPMDNLVSMKGIAENKNKPWGQMASEMGTKDLFTKGLGTRVIMIGTLTGLQWWIYGSWKSFMGFGTQ
jgi:solute carrier family 25 phosphate transporter 3